MAYSRIRFEIQNSATMDLSSMKNNEVRTARLSRIGLLIRVAVGCTFCSVSMMFAVRLEMLWSQL